MVNPSSGVTGTFGVVGDHPSRVDTWASSMVCAALSMAPSSASIVSAVTFVAVSM